MNNERIETIGEKFEMPKNDGYEELPNIGEYENWSGEYQNY